MEEVYEYQYDYIYLIFSEDMADVYKEIDRQREDITVYAIKN